MSLRETLIEMAKQRQRIPLDDLDWPGVYAQRMSARERMDYEDWTEADAKASDKDRNLGRLCKMLIGALVLEDGSPLFKTDDLDTVKNLPADMVQRAFEKCCEVNVMRQKDVEDTAKNSEGGHCAASVSSLQEPSSIDRSANGSMACLATN